MAESKDVLIVAETAQGKLPATAYELLGAGLGIAHRTGGALCAALCGNCDEALARDLIARGVQRVYMIAYAEAALQVVEARLPALVEVCRRAQPRLVLIAHDVSGAELAPRLAFRLDVAVATGCIDVDVQDERVCCTRPCYGGIAHEVNAFAEMPVIATVRSGVFEPAAEQTQRTGEIVAIALATEQATGTRVLERKLEATEGIRLQDARVIVAGGRGLEGADGFRVLETLARELGGAVGASRVPCDLGWCPHSWQIGLTGKTVTPELYIAVGISGAGHHMAGCGNAKTIVAINTDPGAGIFRDARFGVVGDYREVVPALAAEVRRIKIAQEKN